LATSWRVSAAGPSFLVCAAYVVAAIAVAAVLITRRDA